MRKMVRETRVDKSSLVYPIFVREGENIREEIPTMPGPVREAVSGIGGGQSGDIVIPVYLGGTLLDEVIVNAQQRANLRSGGR